MPVLDVDSLITGNIDSQLTSNNFSINLGNNFNYNGKKLRQVTGTTGVGFGTSGVVAWLNVAAGLPNNVLAIGPNQIVIPAGAIIVGAYIQDNAGTATGTTFNVGTELVTVTAPVGNTNLFTSTPVAYVNSGALVEAYSVSATIGTAGAILVSLSPSATTNSGVSIVATGSSAVTAGIRVTIYYYY